MPQDDNQKLYFHTCICGAHAYTVERVGWGTDQVDIDISLWHRGNRYWSWKDRLRAIWRVIKYGDPGVDDVLLTEADAVAFADCILRIVGGAE